MVVVEALFQRSYRKDHRMKFAWLPGLEQSYCLFAVFKTFAVFGRLKDRKKDR